MGVYDARVAYGNCYYTGRPPPKTTSHGGSVLMRRQSKPQAEAGVSAETQTDVHLAHQVRSVTWIPVVDTIDPVHDIDEDFYEEKMENANEVMDRVDKGIEDCVPVQAGGYTSVDDVDSLEIAGSELEDNPENVSMEIMPCTLMFTMIMIFIMAYSKQVEAAKRVARSLRTTAEPEPCLCPVEPSMGQRAERTDWSQRNQNSKPKSLNPNGVRAKLKMKRGITLDSGAHHNVMPRRMVNQKKIRPSKGSLAGMHYIAANKGRIPNEGEVEFEFETLEGELENWLFQIAEVNKALGAIADRVDNNYRVVFDKNMETGHDASYVLNKRTNKILKSSRVGNVWVIEAIIDAENAGIESFMRRG